MMDRNQRQWEKLLERSLGSALAAIEVYNKPIFQFREETFVILTVNSWELLLKSRILKDADDDLTSLYVLLPDGTPKVGRSGNFFTIEITRAVQQLALEPTISRNLEQLLEIRDTAIHLFIENDDAVRYVVFGLGVASLKNYQALVAKWFSRSLADYNLYIMPLTFAHHFQTISAVDLDRKAPAVSNILRSVSETRNTLPESTDYHFICEVSVELISAKKIVDADLVAAIDPESANHLIVRWQRPIDKYPLSYTAMFSKIKGVRPKIKQPLVNAIIKKYQIKEDKRFSYYNFATKEHEDRYRKDGVLPKVIPSIYNEDAVRFIVAEIDSLDQ